MYSKIHFFFFFFNLDTRNDIRVKISYWNTLGCLDKKRQKTLWEKTWKCSRKAQKILEFLSLRNDFACPNCQYQTNEYDYQFLKFIDLFVMIQVFEPYYTTPLLESLKLPSQNHFCPYLIEIVIGFLRRWILFPIDYFCLIVLDESKYMLRFLLWYEIFLRNKPNTEIRVKITLEYRIMNRLGRMVFLLDYR